MIKKLQEKKCHPIHLNPIHPSNQLFLPCYHFLYEVLTLYIEYLQLTLVFMVCEEVGEKVDNRANRGKVLLFGHDW